jgi:hypothetical protein
LIFGVGFAKCRRSALTGLQNFFTLLPILLPLNSLNPSWDGSQSCNIKNLENPKITDVIEVIGKVTLAFALSLGLLSPLIPSFSGIRKGRKFY